jgi:hypothetical protein
MVTSTRDAMKLANHIEEIKRELVYQWRVNHGEHCGLDLAPPWPHKGDCQWPAPKSLSDSEFEHLLSS